MKLPKLKKLGIAFVLSYALTQSGCAMMTASGVIEGHASFCQVAKPIAWGSQDTDETIVQVKEHNEIGKDSCGWVLSAEGE